MPRFLANSFLALNYVFSVQVWYICLNLIDLIKKKVHFVYSKQNLRPKNCLLEIGASNLEEPLLKFQYSSSLVHNADAVAFLIFFENVRNRNCIVSMLVSLQT